MTNHIYTLTVRKGPQEGRSFPLVASTITVGRDPMSDIVLTDPEVSRQHARLTRTEAGYVVQDLGSTNGTFVDGRRLTGEEVPLTSGAVLTMGSNVTLIYEVAPDPMATVVSAEPEFEFSPEVEEATPEAAVAEAEAEPEPPAMEEEPELPAFEPEQELPAFEPEPEPPSFEPEPEPPPFEPEPELPSFEPEPEPEQEPPSFELEPEQEPPAEPLEVFEAGTVIEEKWDVPESPAEPEVPEAEITSIEGPAVEEPEPFPPAEPFSWDEDLEPAVKPEEEAPSFDTGPAEPAYEMPDQQRTVLDMEAQEPAFAYDYEEQAPSDDLPSFNDLPSFEEPAAPAYAPVEPAAMEAPPPSPPPPVAEPTGSNRNRNIAIAAVVLILLCCCCLVVTGYFYWGDLLLDYLGLTF